MAMDDRERRRTWDRRLATTIALASEDETTHARKAKRLRGQPRASDATPAALVATERKSLYYRKRDERDELIEHVRSLDAQLEELRVRAGLPSKADKAAIGEIETNSSRLDEALHITDQYMGRLQSMIEDKQFSIHVNPMSTFIHLPRDMKQRRTILQNMQSVKLRRGIEVLVESLHHVDPLLPFMNQKQFGTGTGEYQCYRLEINQFPNFRSARQLFDTLVSFLASMEVNITIELDQLTLREDTDDFIDPTIWNHRVVTVSDDVGCVEELNTVGFAGFYNSSQYTQSPMGIIVLDTVNVDDLYPYRPLERTCKDVQAAHMVYEMRKPGTDEVVVVLKQVFNLVQLPPQFELAPGGLKQLHHNMTKWLGLLAKYLHEYVGDDTKAGDGIN